MLRKIGVVTFLLSLVLPQVGVTGVNPRNGFFSLEYIDCVLSQGYEFQLSRSYQSRSTYRGIFGHKWQSLIEHRLEFGTPSENPETITLVEFGGGVRNIFYRESPTLFVSRQFPGQKLHRKGDWWIRKHSPADEAEEYYDLRGKLIRLLNKNRFVDIQYNRAGRIALISDQLGQKLEFTVNDKGLVTRVKRIDPKISTPAECRYSYNPKDELTSARNELGKTYSYDYDLEGRHLLVQVNSGYAAPLVLTYYPAHTPEGKLQLIRSQKNRDGELTHYTFDLEKDGRVFLRESITTQANGTKKTTLFESGTGREIEAQDLEKMTPEEEKILRTFLPALTMIHVHNKSGRKSGGTGFFISPDGVLLTNKHVIEGAIRYPDHFLTVTLPNPDVLKENWTGLTKSQIRPKLEVGATITQNIKFISCGVSYGRDLCLLKLNLYPSKNFSIDHELPKEGSPLFTIGNPRLKGLLIDHGTFLDRRNHNGVSEVSISIKTRPGNSGGPIFTAGGKLLGILTAQYTYKNPALATEQNGISAFEVKTLMDKYVTHPVTFSLEDFRRTIPADMVWYEKKTEVSPQPEKLESHI